ncbi:MAG: type Z 30S ribosomal protein S14 [Patescibacteria group bacterium]|nr:type Z 30S ribosomal protein S14 [Patescibacteria group bacterium]
MAKKSMVLKSLKKPKYSTRIIRRCGLCGRPKGYMRKYGICRICFRSHASKGNIPGVTKASW